MSIGDRIKEERTKRGLSIRGLALKCKHTQFSTIAKIENGVNQPNTTTIQDIAQALNLEVSSLIDNNAIPITLDRLTTACEKAGVDPQDIDSLSQEQIDLAVSLFKQMLNNKK